MNNQVMENEKFRARMRTRGFGAKEAKEIAAADLILISSGFKFESDDSDTLLYASGSVANYTKIWVYRPRTMSSLKYGKALPAYPVKVEQHSEPGYAEADIHLEREYNVCVRDVETIIKTYIAPRNQKKKTDTMAKRYGDDVAKEFGWDSMSAGIREKIGKEINRQVEEYENEYNSELVDLVLNDAVLYITEWAIYNASEEVLKSFLDYVGCKTDEPVNKAMITILSGEEAFGWIYGRKETSEEIIEEFERYFEDPCNYLFCDTAEEEVP